MRLRIQFHSQSSYEITVDGKHVENFDNLKDASQFARGFMKGQGGPWGVIAAGDSYEYEKYGVLQSPA